MAELEHTETLTAEVEKLALAGKLHSGSKEMGCIFLACSSLPAEGMKVCYQPLCVWGT